MKKQSGWKTKGMNRDFSVSAFNPEFAFENMNLRLSTNEGNTLMSWVNERGTKEVELREEDENGDYVEFPYIQGTCIGTAILNSYLVLFMTNCGNDPDAIYRLRYSEGKLFFEVKRLYQGSLGFDVRHPIETLVFYESEDIQKVYWVDGINQPRIINIAKRDTSKYSDTYFDFIPTLKLEEVVHVRKILGGGGAFAPGVIQYAFTYYNKYGQESNIFYTTPLYYISHLDRGASPEDKVDNAFRITIESVDTNFEFLRIYSIQRTSINSTPFCKRVQDIDLRDIEPDGNGIYKVSYLDAGNNGDSIDPTELLYKGGRALAAGTMEQKDNTLFLGDVTTEEPLISPEIAENIKVNSSDSNYRTFTPTIVSTNGYVYANQLTSYKGDTSVPCGGFKKGNYYRCGVQFQDTTGRWTHPVFLKDVSVEGTPSISYDLPSVYNPDITVPDNAVTVSLTINSKVQAYATGVIYMYLHSDLGNVRVTLSLPGAHITNKYAFKEGCSYTYNNVVCTFDNGADAAAYTGSQWEIPQMCVNPGAGTPVTNLIKCDLEGEGDIFRKGGHYELTILSYSGPVPEDTGGSGGSSTPDPAVWGDPSNEVSSGDTWPGTSIPYYTDNPGSNGIKFVIHNLSGETVAFSGKFVLYISSSPDCREGFSSELEAHFNGPSEYQDGYLHWNANGRILANGASITRDAITSTVSYTVNLATSPRTLVQGGTSLESGYYGKYFVTADNQAYRNAIAAGELKGSPAIKLGAAWLPVGRSDIGNSPQIIHIKPLPTGANKIIKGRTYNLIIDEVHHNAEYRGTYGTLSLGSDNIYRMAVARARTRAAQQPVNEDDTRPGDSEGGTPSTSTTGPVSVKMRFLNNTVDDFTFDGGVYIILYDTANERYIRLKGTCSGDTFFIPHDESKIYTVRFPKTSGTIAQDPAKCVGMSFATQEQRGVYASNVAYSKNGIYHTCNEINAVFQHNATYNITLPTNTHEWSSEEGPTVDPDTPNTNTESQDASVTVSLPVIHGAIPEELATFLMDQGFVKVRPVVVFPTIQDRIKLCQGVINPTLYTDNHRGYSTNVTEDSNKITQDIYAQSSWFFRSVQSSVQSNAEPEVTTNAPKSDHDDYIGYYNCNSHLRKVEGGVGTGEESISDDKPTMLRLTEIQGLFDKKNQFKVDWNTVTFHSPDVEFDDALKVMDYNSGQLGFRSIGSVKFTKTLSDIDIQTETPTISNDGSGFLKKAFTKKNSSGIISGLFYDDYLVDDNSTGAVEDDGIGFYKFVHQKYSAKWMVYLWNKDGSLNNDINRPSNGGVATAVLKKKIISNLRYAETSYGEAGDDALKLKTQMFESEGSGMLKLDVTDSTYASLYFGNVNTMLNPDNSDGMYFAYDKDGPVDFTATVNYKTCALKEDANRGIWDFRGGRWTSYFGVTGSKPYWELTEEELENASDDFFSAIGEDFIALDLKKDPVRMKYKSSSHLVLMDALDAKTSEDDTLRILELERKWDSDEERQSVIFGGISEDALKENVWVPCGEPVRLDMFSSDDWVHFEYSYGDTYFQRWDCLKTYAYTPEDINQVVEIGSFMLESYINLDGRYDRNRGQLSNLYMNPQNFNLLNPVYSQHDNFFQYRILDKDMLGKKRYNNQITWTKTKTSGADVDMWTNITLASVLELDGDKGPVNKLTRFNNNLFCFQDRGMSRILYNDNVQIQSTQGVPIEIANSGKVQGKDYVSDSIGCTNKWSLATTPAGIYFIDSFDRNIYMYNGQLNNISGSLGMTSWAKQNIPPANIGWTPYGTVDNGIKIGGFGDFVTYNDRVNNDILFINSRTALAFSERLGSFTSFYDYGNTPYFCNLDSEGIWVRNHEDKEENPCVTLYEHQKGEYCNFFGENKPYWMVLVGNPEPQLDKIFTNLEFRACVEGDGELDQETGKFTPALPFDSLETWNEYQKGLVSLTHRNGHDAMRHHTKDNIASLKRKFRIWRCDIPRDNAENINVFDGSFDTSFLFPKRRKHSVDRMRNPWLYLKLTKKAAETGFLPKTEIHDLLMTYFG